ncbi:GNAT family N-acetyltransferase [Butyrivibrio sp. XB500-5]|uniref:GNAT family N-acetyltransferase n=1 Tax=Butyrivibrio sp. XB500-5 TaxID=2364880 RepID=UPI0018F6CCBB|nr:GNAT family N-acetyltransferase [Butyrivibrio sp. XB500-5]
MENYSIRKATINDLDSISELEATCFPAAEAAKKESFKSRLDKYPDYFFLLFISGKLVSMVNGLVTDIPDLQDEMYDDAGMHDPNGAWQMIFGVDTHPDYQRNGYAEATLKAFIENTRKENRKGVVLTCKDKLLHYYEKFGFVNEGISDSTHGDVTWYQMRLKF